MKHEMIRLAGGIGDRGRDIVAFQEGIILQNLLEAGTGTDQLQYVGDAKSLAADARASTALARLYGDPLKQVRSHLEISVPHVFTAGNTCRKPQGLRQSHGGARRRGF